MLVSSKGPARVAIDTTGRKDYASGKRESKLEIPDSSYSREMFVWILQMKLQAGMTAEPALHRGNK